MLCVCYDYFDFFVILMVNEINDVFFFYGCVFMLFRLRR